jgi:hypothetical protein
MRRRRRTARKGDDMNWPLRDTTSASNNTDVRWSFAVRAMRPLPLRWWERVVLYLRVLYR